MDNPERSGNEMAREGIVTCLRRAGVERSS